MKIDIRNSFSQAAEQAKQSVVAWKNRSVEFFEDPNRIKTSAVVLLGAIPAAYLAKTYFCATAGPNQAQINPSAAPTKMPEGTTAEESGSLVGYVLPIVLLAGTILAVYARNNHQTAAKHELPNLPDASPEETVASTAAQRPVGMREGEGSSPIAEPTVAGKMEKSASSEELSQEAKPNPLGRHQRTRSVDLQGGSAAEAAPAELGSVEALEANHRSSEDLAKDLEDHRQEETAGAKLALAATGADARPPA